MVGFYDFYNSVAEYRFDVKVRGLSKDGDTGDLQNGGCEPEYSDNDMSQGMMYGKSLQKQACREHKEGKDKDRKSEVQTGSRIWRV